MYIFAILKSQIIKWIARDRRPQSVGKVVYDSKTTVMNAITAIPATRALNCFIDSFASSSLSKSGNTVTNEMCKKPPAVNGMIHDVRASIADVTFVPPIATSAPISPAPAVSNWAFAASHRLNPDRKRMAKSPTSCGISCTVDLKNQYVINC